ncbi:hypothetical protein BC629DRAFT_797752 [Irpex lacteus]|nr:hypothetical protein BC629DRAFT_797752 [Irpex lacteus]
MSGRLLMVVPRRLRRVLRMTRLWRWWGRRRYRLLLLLLLLHLGIGRRRRWWWLLSFPVSLWRRLLLPLLLLLITKLLSTSVVIRRGVLEQGGDIHGGEVAGEKGRRRDTQSSLVHTVRSDQSTSNLADSPLSDSPRTLCRCAERVRLLGSADCCLCACCRRAQRPRRVFCRRARRGWGTTVEVGNAGARDRR